MLTPGLTRVLATAWALGALLVAPTAAAAAPHEARQAEAGQLSQAAAAPPAGPCEVTRPASGGRLTLNPSAVQRGGTVVAVVSELPRFPEQIVGAGSLEFFGFCLPSPDGQRLDIGMGPVEGPVVVPLQVPEDTPLGRHAVEVVFSEGRGGFSAAAEDEVVLSAPLEVTAQPPPLRAADPDTPPCGLSAGTPPSGVLTVSPTVGPAGNALQVKLEEPPARLRRGNDYSGHYVTCFAGRAAVAPRPDAQAPDDLPPPLVATVPLPADLPPGRHQVRVLALLEDDTRSWVGWTSTVTVRTAERPVPRGGVDAGLGGLARDDAGPGREGAVLAGGLVLLAALSVAVHGRRRQSG